MQLLEIFIKYVKMFIFSRQSTSKMEFNKQSSSINIFREIELQNLQKENIVFMVK